MERKGITRNIQQRAIRIDAKSEKFALVEQVYRSEWEQVIDNLLLLKLEDYQRSQAEYMDVLRKFEGQYEMKTEEFYPRFEAGELGDVMDFFE